MIREGSRASECCELSGKAQVCTADGAKYRFDLSGNIFGAWLHTDGAKMILSLREPGHLNLPREFSLYGVWRGPNLVLDDQKSMYIHFLLGGNLTPAPSYTSPVPDKHASVTFSSGGLNDFESLCTGLGTSTRNSNR